MPLRSWTYKNDTFDDAGDWANFVEGLFNDLLGAFYEQTDPVDDIDRIYRQQEAQAFMGILDDIAAGTADWRDLASFEVDYLSDIDGFTEFVSESISAAQYQGLYSDLANASTNEDFQRIFNEYANAGIETNPYIQNDLASTGSATAVLTGTIDNSILEQIIRDAALGDGILGGEVDFEDLPGYGGIWDGLIRHIKVIGRGINLPIPDWLPLPGIFELPTIGEIFDTVTGPWKEAAQDALRDCMAGPDGTAGTADDKAASVCLEEQSVIDILVDGIGNATSDIYDATSKKVQDIFGEEGVIDRCASNPSGCAQEVFDKLKDIFGEGAVDPTSTGGNIPDWMKVIIIGGAYGDEILGELEDLFGGDINDDGTIGIVGPEEPQPFDCTTVGKFNPDGGAASEADCINPCQYNSNIPETSPECVATADFDCASVGKQGGMVQSEDQCGECLQGYDEVDGQCQEKEDPIPNQGPTAAECAAEHREFNEATDVADSSCGPCLSGWREEGDVCVEDTGGPQPEGCEAVDCNSPRPSASTFEGQAAFRLWNDCCGSTHCPDGSLQQEGFDCAGNPTGPEQCQDPNRDTNTDGSCADTCKDGSVAPETGLCPEAPSGEDCTNGATNYPDCDQCPDGQSLVNGQCVQDTFECDQQDRVTNKDGSCGECKPGFIEDPEGFDQCIQAPPECNDCSCAEYAAANPIECETGAEEPEPEDEEDDGGSVGGGGAVGGGGGRSMFQPYSFAISADPQLLTRSEFPITDFLAGIFTNSRGGRNV